MPLGNELSNSEGFPKYTNTYMYVCMWICMYVYTYMVLNIYDFKIYMVKAIYICF